MAGDAYTPGLSIVSSTTLRKTRRLPLLGDVVVSLGDQVSAQDVVARTLLPGPVHLINIANRLSILPEEVDVTLKCPIGASFSQGDVIAEHRAFFGLFRSVVNAPIDGTLESVSSITGQAVLRETPVPVEVTSYVDGKVVDILDKEGIVVESQAALIQGIFGLGGEVFAPLHCVCTNASQDMDADLITDECRGKIIVGGGQISLEAMKHAMTVGVVGIITGGIAYQDVKELLGYDVGVAITGTEPIETTLVITEGFGDIAMAKTTFELLLSHHGQMASMNGATQIRSGVIRPEVVIPVDFEQENTTQTKGLVEGTEVRCIRAPYFGKVGKVVSLPVALQVMASETKVRVVEVIFEDGQKTTVPRANVEILEQ